LKCKPGYWNPYESGKIEITDKLKENYINNQNCIPWYCMESQDPTLEKYKGLDPPFIPESRKCGKCFDTDTVQDLHWHGLKYFDKNE